MPKLYTDEPDKFWKVGDKEYRIDKENAECIYSDEEHVYISKKDNSRYISATTLISKYSGEFDGDFWSSYKALEEIMDGDTFSVLKKALLATKKFNPKILKKFQIDEELFAQKKLKFLLNMTILAMKRVSMEQQNIFVRNYHFMEIIILILVGMVTKIFLENTIAKRIIMNLI